LTEEDRRLTDGALTRREAILHGGTGLVLLCSFDQLAVKSRPNPKKTAASRRRELTGLFDPFKRDLPRPAVAEPVSTANGVDRYEITMQEGTAEILEGLETPIRGYDGMFPGPTIRARKGRPVVVKQTNELDHETIVHLHGGAQEEESDGALHRYWIQPGDDYTYTYWNQQDQATLWYHDHIHGRTGEHVFAGLAGFYILSDELDEKLGLPRGQYDVPLVIQDRAFNSDGSFRYVRSVEPGMHADTILVNGAIVPRMAVKRRIYRFRLLNGSNARCYQLQLGNGREMFQIASDGGLLPKPIKRTQIPLAPAQRAEVLIDFRKYAPGSKLILRNKLGDATTSAVMRFDVTKGGGREQARIPKKLRPAETIPSASKVRAFELTFEATPTPRWLINGKEYDENRVDADPKLGTTEYWRFINNSDHQHPMHLHACHFRVIEVNGVRPHPADRHWRDTVSVPPRGHVTIQPYFKDYAGQFVFHCHTLEHEDQSMMGSLVVRP